MTALINRRQYANRWNEGRSRLGPVGPKTFHYPQEWDAFTGHFHSDSPWYESTWLVIRKGQLLAEGLQTLEPIEPGVFRVAAQSIDVDRVVFDTIIDGRAMRATYSGIEFFRALTP